MDACRAAPGDGRPGHRERRPPGGGQPAAVRRATSNAADALPLLSDGELGAKVLEAIEAGSLLVPLAEIENHEVRLDLHRQSGYTVGGRLKECVGKLVEFVALRP